MAEDEGAELAEGLQGHFVEGPIPIVTTSTDAPIVFADFLWHAVSMNGMIRMAFTAYSADPPDHPDPGFKGRHVATVVMPISTLEGTIRYLQDTLKDMTNRGIINGD